jgi:DNA-binding transcriptional MerR regulator
VRSYDEADVARLYRIGLLRRLGFALDQIGALLDSPHWQLRDSVSRHLDDLHHRIELALLIRARLSGTATALDSDEETDGRPTF